MTSDKALMSNDAPREARDECWRRPWSDRVVPVAKRNDELRAALVLLLVIAAASGFFISKNVWTEDWTTSEGWRCRQNVWGDVEFQNPHLTGEPTWSPTTFDSEPFDGKADRLDCYG